MDQLCSNLLESMKPERYVKELWSQ